MAIFAADEVFFLAQTGIPVRRIPRDDEFCRLLSSRSVVIVEDSAQDARCTGARGGRNTPLPLRAGGCQALAILTCLQGCVPPGLQVQRQPLCGGPQQPEVLCGRAPAGLGRRQVWCAHLHRAALRAAALGRRRQPATVFTGGAGDAGASVQCAQLFLSYMQAR